MRGRLFRGVWIFWSLFVGVAAGAKAQDPATAGTARVTYISGPSYYISAGREDGLIEGSEVMVFEGDSTVARLRVRYLSSHQSECVAVNGESAVKVGDVVRFTPTAKVSSPLVIATDSGRRRPPEMASGNARLHGRIGVRYLAVNDNGAGLGYGQPAADMRMAGENLPGALGLAVDVRARRTTSSFSGTPDRTESHTAAYEANIFWRNPRSPFRVSLGRQYSQSLSAVNLFDGGLVEFYKPTWRTGAFAGVQPDPDLGFSTDVQEFGGFFGLSSRPGSSSNWGTTIGVVGSYFQGKANREFAYLQLAYSDRNLSVFGAQELDYYRPWKMDAGEQPLSLTSTYATANLRLDRRISLYGGYDTRRNVRLYQDVVDPVTSFDDAYRQGAWGGIGISDNRWRVSFDARSSFGGPDGTANALTGTAGVNRISNLGISVWGRVTRYTNPRLDGWLYALRGGGDIAGPLHLELNGGVRKETEPLAFPTDRSITWFGADLDLALGRSWYLLFSANREIGDPGRSDQLYTALTWRF